MKGQGDLLPGKTCPTCGGRLREEIRSYSLGRVFFGNYPFWVCVKEGHVLTPLATYSLLEKVARAKGLWGKGSHPLDAPHPLLSAKAERASA